MLSRLLLTGLLPLLALGLGPAAPALAAEGVLLALPYRSQIDGSPYERSNCGPASLAMVLAGFGLEVPNDELRAQVNDLQGTWDDFQSGTAIHNLATIARSYGLRPLDLYGPKGLRRWTLDDVRRHLDAGHPVIPQVEYPALPGRAEASYRGDHYIVLVGYTGDEFLYHDPVPDAAGGKERRISAEQLTVAWSTGDLPFAGLAFAGPANRTALQQRPAPAPRPTRTPTPTLTPTPTATPPPTATPTVTPTPSPSPTVTPSPTASPTTTPSPTASPTVAPTPTASPPPAPVTPDQPAAPAAGGAPPPHSVRPSPGPNQDLLAGWSLVSLAALFTAARGRAGRRAGAAPQRPAVRL
jgi:hypothetical protein